jgi:hypothetical protein
MRRRTAFLTAMMLLLPTIASAESPVTFLPIGKSMAAGQELQLPVGLTLTYYHQQQDYDLKKITLPRLQIPVGTEGIKVENWLNEENLRLDAWVFPWLNVFGILGKLQATTSVDNVALMGQPIAVPDYDYDGWVYGGGATLAAGSGPWFGAVTGIYTTADLTKGGSSVTTWVLTPKIGYNFGPVRLWTGAMYQKAEEKHSGTFTMNLPVNFANPAAGFSEQSVDYEVELREKSPWNALLGLEGSFGPHWLGSVEGGFGGHRTQIQVSLTARI